MAVVHYPAVDRADRPDVSVCIANYNGEQMLADCIKSVLGQENVGSIEIIVHDDASTDGSVALLRSRYPQVEVLASESNVGFCVSNNRMVAAARGEFVLLLNNDAALFPDAIATLRAAARANPSAILTLPQFDWASGDIVDRGCLLDPFYNPVPNLDPSRRDVAYVIGACLWIPHSLWNELGGFPEWMGSIGEDMYLSCQARLRGYPVQSLPDSGYRHRQGHSFGGNRINDGRLHSTFRRRALSERNKIFVLLVMTPGTIVWPLLAAHLMAIAIEGVVLVILKRDASIWKRIYWPAMTAPFCHPSVIRKYRKEEQAKRTIHLQTFLSTTQWVPRKLSLLWRHGFPGLE